MELLNNRYRIIEIQKQNRMFSTYTALDLWNKNQKMKLTILNANFTPSSLIDFYSKEFISLVNLNCSNILKNYYFNRVLKINNKEATEEQYFYTCEYVKKSKDLLKFIAEMNLFEVMDVFIEICKAINYLHLKGYTYDELNLNNIFVIEKDGNYKIKLNDLATVELEKYYYMDNKIHNSYFKSPTVLSGENSSKNSDIYSLSVILLTMLRKKSPELNPKEDLKTFIAEIKNNNTNYTTKEVDYIIQILSVLETFITVNEPYEKDYVYNLVSKLNIILNKDYKIFCKEELEKLNLRTKLINRENEINRIIEAYDSMIEFKPNKKIFLIKGDFGTGKTRFLEEIQFLLELKKANVYSSFSLNNSRDSNDKLWAELIKKLISESDTEIIEKYKHELVKFFPGIMEEKNTLPYINSEYLMKGTVGYRLLNRIVAFINDSIKNKPTVFIIDDINYGNEFTLNTFAYLCETILDNKNIMLIFAYQEGKVLEHEAFPKFIDNINNRKDSATIHIKNLNAKETGKLIKEIMFMHYILVFFSNRIYSQSQGNPLFTVEILKELFNSKKIYIDDKSGLWHVDMSDPEKEDAYYKHLKIPSNIEEVLLNQLEDLDNISYEILKVISIFNNPIPIEILFEFIGIKPHKLEESVEKLVNKGILYRKITNKQFLYDINNKMLKFMVYKNMNKEEKIKKHKLAANLIENKDYLTANIDELIFHLENSNNKMKAKEYCLKNAKKMKALKNVQGEIENLEKALSMIDDENIIEKTHLLIRLSILYLETENFQLAIDYLNKAEKLAKITKNQKHLVDIYVNMALAMDALYRAEKTTEYIEKAEKILENFEYQEASLELKRIKATQLMNKNMFDESIQLLLEIIEQCGNNFDKIKGNAYRNLAFVYTHLNKIEEAIALYKKSIKLLKKVNYISGILIALNNIGTIYSDNYHDLEKALSYFTKIRDLGEEHNLINGEMLGLINIASIHHVKYNYDKAYSHFKFALEKALNLNNPDMVFYLYITLTDLCIDMDKYSEAYHYYNLSQKYFEKHPDRGIYIPQFYRTIGNLFNAYGDFEKADKFYSKAISFYKPKDSALNINNIIDSNIIKIRFKDINTYDSNIEEIVTYVNKLKDYNLKIDSLCETAIILKEKKDTKNSKKLLAKAEKYISKSIHPKIKAKYYYTKAIVEEENNSKLLLIKALKLAEKEKSKKLVANINIELGNYYFHQENYYYAVNYYIEACDILKKLIYQIPEKFRLKYVNSYKLALPFYKVKYINNFLMISNEYNILNNNQFENNFSIDSYEELYKLINTDDINRFINNKDFLHFLSRQIMLKGIYTEKDVLANISGNTYHDINIIIKYLASITLATKGILAMEGQKQDLNIIYSIGNNFDLLANKYIFDRVRATKEPFLVSNKETYKHNPLEDRKAYLCIPIINNNSNSRQNILGYLYLESHKVLNNITKEGLQVCLYFSNLLALLLEKRKLEIEASTDKLTGALTRKYLEDALQNILNNAKDKNEIFSIIMYDLDRFKRVNDKFGHLTGDKVLRKIAEIVMNNIGPKDILGRYGGEEFLIILPNTDAKEALAIAEDLRIKIQNGKILSEEIDITVSMGVASYPAHGQTINELIEKVDQALYIAKENGRNRCQLWNESFSNIIKPINAIDGILTGNEVQDSRNILALIELIELTTKNVSKDKKIYYFLGRTIELLEAQLGIVFLIDNGRIVEIFGRKIHMEQWLDNIDYNQSVVKSVIETKQGIYMIDWDEIEKYDNITGLPDWNSLLVTPILFEDKIKGVLYLATSTRIKEFGIKDLSFANVLTNILANII